MATRQNLTALIDDIEFGPVTPAPFYDRRSDSLMFYARDVPSFANRLNSRFSTFLDSNDESLVGFEIKGFSQIVKLISKFGKQVSVTSKTVRISEAVKLALVPEHGHDWDNDETIEQIVMFIDVNQIGEKDVGAESLEFA